MDINYDTFIKLTDDYHEKTVQNILEIIREIYIKALMKVGIVHPVKHSSQKDR